MKDLCIQEKKKNRAKWGLPDTYFTKVSDVLHREPPPGQPALGARWVEIIKY